MSEVGLGGSEYGVGETMARKRPKWPNRPIVYRQLDLFNNQPTANKPPIVITARGLIGTGPAPPRESNWLASFLVPEQLPTIRHRRSA